MHASDYPDETSFKKQWRYRNDWIDLKLLDLIRIKRVYFDGFFG